MLNGDAGPGPTLPRSGSLAANMVMGEQWQQDGLLMHLVQHQQQWAA